MDPAPGTTFSISTLRRSVKKNQTNSSKKRNANSKRIQGPSFGAPYDWLNGTIVKYHVCVHLDVSNYVIHVFDLASTPTGNAPTLVRVQELAIDWEGASLTEDDDASQDVTGLYVWSASVVLANYFVSLGKTKLKSQIEYHPDLVDTFFPELMLLPRDDYRDAKPVVTSTVFGAGQDYVINPNTPCHFD